MLYPVMHFLIGYSYKTFIFRKIYLNSHNIVKV